MRCGATCFYVHFDTDGEKQTKSVIARTPVEARKNFRKEHGGDADIISVRKRKRNES